MVELKNAISTRKICWKALTLFSSRRSKKKPPSSRGLGMTARRETKVSLTGLERKPSQRRSLEFQQ